MHIGLFHESKLPPKSYGGIERIVVTLASEYFRRGHKVTVFCRKGSVLPNCQIVEIPESFDGDLNPFLPANVEFLHSHQPLKVRPEIPFVITIHGNGHMGERYFPNTNFLSQSHARNHNAKYFVYNGVDPTHYPFTDNKQDYFVFLARTTWRVKNLKTAIQWANDLNLNLEIMGGSGLSRGNIRYHGLVNEEQKLNLLAGARALIYPTNWDEPCAAAPLEALACGTPVITTSNG
jgi:glycosyltransferase involved in cell wall biosynthesis